MRGGKGGRRAKTLVLVWTLRTEEFRHQQTTRRRALGDCPDVLLSPAACGVSA
jgi:hypothetical protein